MHSENKNHVTWGVILIALGVLFILDNFGYLDFGYVISTYWPLILVAIGIKIILDKRGSDTKDMTGTSTFSSNLGETLTENNVFGDIKIKSDSKTFTGGSVNNVFGDIYLDLSNIQLKNDQTNVLISGVFGDINVLLPASVAIKTRCSAVAGDIFARGSKKDGLLPTLEQQDDNYSAKSPRLFVQVSIVFGSISVRSV